MDDYSVDGFKEQSELYFAKAATGEEVYRVVTEHGNAIVISEEELDIMCKGLGVLFKITDGKENI